MKWHREQDGSDHQAVVRETLGVGAIHHAQDQHEERIGQQQCGKVLDAQMAEKHAFRSSTADTDTDAP